MTGSVREQPAVVRTVCYVASSVASMALPVLTLPIMTRWLTPEDYGVIALGQVVAILFMGLVNLGVSTGLERNFFKYEADPGRLAALIHSGIALMGGGLLVWGVLFFAGRHAIAWVVPGTRDWGLLIWVMCLTATLGLVITMQLVYLRNRGRASEYMTYSVTGVVLESLLSVGLVVFAEAGVWGIVAGQFLAKTALGAALGWRLTRELPLRFDRDLARELLGLGLPLTPCAVVGVADKAVDRLLLGWLKSLGQVGVFGLASSVGYSIFSLLTSLEHVYIPQVYRLMFQAGERGGAQIGRYLTPYFYCSLVVPVGVTLFIEEVTWVLVTPAFDGIKDVVPLLAVYYGQTFFGKIVGAQLAFREKLWYATPLGILGLGLHLGFGILLVPRYGAFGAGLAILGAGIVVDGVAFCLGQRVYPIQYEARPLIPLLALLYGSAGWALLPRWLGFAYEMVLAGKVLLVGCLLLTGTRWIPEARQAGERWYRAGAAQAKAVLATRDPR